MKGIAAPDRMRLVDSDQPSISIQRRVSLPLRKLETRIIGVDKVTIHVRIDAV